MAPTLMALQALATSLPNMASAPPPLPAPVRYPFLTAMRENGYEIAAAAAALTFLALLANGGARPGSVVRAVGASAVVGASLAYVHEMTVIVAETLLPE